MSVRRVNHTAVSVRSMERSIAFYTELLGLELLMEMDVDHHEGLDTVVGMIGAVGQVAFLAAGDTLVELWCYTEPSGQPVSAGSIPADLGVRHVAFDVDDVDAMHATLTAAGYRFNSAPVDLGLHKTCYLHGPDDELIELLEDRTDRSMMARINARTVDRRRRVDNGATSPSTRHKQQG